MEPSYDQMRAELLERDAKRLGAQLRELREAASGYRNAEKAYEEGSLRDRVPNGIEINRRRAALDAALRRE